MSSSYHDFPFCFKRPNCSNFREECQYFPGIGKVECLLKSVVRMQVNSHWEYMCIHFWTPIDWECLLSRECISLFTYFCVFRTWKVTFLNCYWSIDYRHFEPDGYESRISVSCASCFLKLGRQSALSRITVHTASREQEFCMNHDTHEQRRWHLRDTH